LAEVPQRLRSEAVSIGSIKALYDDAGAFTQYLHDGSEFATELLERIKFGGWVRLVYDEATEKLFVETEYECEGKLTEKEIAFLVEATVGQWSDGAGGAAMDQFSECIEPYYVEIDEYDPKNVAVTIID
jgi:hypothetical protein